MQNIIFIIDRSDIRNAYLKKMLEYDGYMVFDFEENISAIARYVYIFAPSTLIDMAHAQKVKNGSTVFYLKIDIDAAEDLKMRDVQLENIMDCEIFSHKNAMLTAEGMLPILISNTDICLQSLNILVLGFGRVGKCVCEMLSNLKCNVTPLVTTEQEKIISTVYLTDDFLTMDNFESHLEEFNVIINTVPALILPPSRLRHVKPDTFIIDLASKPGGVDFDYLEKHKIKVIHALSLPAKAAPKDAARFLKERIYKIL